MDEAFLRYILAVKEMKEAKKELTELLGKLGISDELIDRILDELEDSGDAKEAANILQPSPVVPSLKEGDVELTEKGRFRYMLDGNVKTALTIALLKYNKNILRMNPNGAMFIGQLHGGRASLVSEKVAIGIIENATKAIEEGRDDVYVFPFVGKVKHMARPLARDALEKLWKAWEKRKVKA